MSAVASRQRRNARVPDEAAAAPPARRGCRQRRATPLREAVLAGRFFGRRTGRPPRRWRIALAAAAEASLRPVVRRGWRAPRLLRRPGRLRAAIDRDIAAIDALLGSSSTPILHAAPAAPARGLLARSRTGSSAASTRRAAVKVKLLNCPGPNSAATSSAPRSSTRATCSARVYEDEFGMPGGEPYRPARDRP